VKAQAIIVVLGFLGAVLSCDEVRAQTEPAQEDIDAQVRSLIESASHAPKAERWFEENRSRINPQIAEAARQLTIQAEKSRNYTLALSAGTFAWQCYRQLRDPERSLEAEVDVLDVEFTLAETPEAYSAARNRALDISSAATKVDRPDLAFEGEVIAADCTYFSVPPNRHHQDKDWALLELSDLTKTASKAKFAPRDVVFDRFVNLLATVVSELEDEGLRDTDTRFEEFLKNLAAVSDQLIPPNFTYSRPQQYDPNGIQAQKHLGRLSYRYGSALIADERRSWAAQQARDDGDIESWLSLMNERYVDERQAKSPEARLRQLRSDARTVAQTLRESYRTRAGRIWVSAIFDQTYGPMLQDQLEANDSSAAAEVFAASETLKARTLLDEMIARPTELAEIYPEAGGLEAQVLGFAPSSDPQENLVLQEINLLSQLSPFGPLGDPHNSRQKPLEQLERLHRKGRAGFGNVVQPASLEQVKSALQLDEAMLEYVIPFNQFSPNQHLWIFLITKESCRIAHVALDTVLPRDATNSAEFSVDGKAPIQTSPLGNLLVELRKEIRISDDQSARDNLNAFYQILIQPLVDQGFNPGRYRRLIIVPHGPLHYVPFSALLDESGTFLIEKTAITIVPSASVWVHLQERSGRVNSFVGFGNPTLNRPNVTPLPWAEKEVVRIAGLLPLEQKDKQVYTAEQATADRFLDMASHADLLHIATHGEFPDENALDQHAVLLANGAKEEGLVLGSFIRKLDLSSNRVTVLSVCNGGLYRIGPADEPYGLLPAFLQAGSQNVVGTLWAVEDRYGQKLTTEFYTNLLEVGPAEALRQADRVFIADGQLIRRWAGFVVVGPGRPLADPTQQ
jgi:CHAT domain-containing protein